MIDRYVIRYFLAVIDHGNFSRAAAQCNVSQPTLSVGIAKLERLLGAVLFERTNRRVELTVAGARFAAHARRIEAEFGLAERAVRQAGAPETVRLGVLTTIPTAWIERMVAALHAADAPERLELVEARERDLLEQLGRSRIDVALTLVRSDNDRFHAERLFSEGYALALGLDHPFAGRATVRAEDLADNVMIVRRHCEALSETSRHFTSRGVRPFFAARTTNDDRATALVRAGLGITVMPCSFAGPGIAMPGLAGFRHRRTIGMVFGAHVDVARIRDTASCRTIAATLRALGAPLDAGRDGERLARSNQ